MSAHTTLSRTSRALGVVAIAGLASLTAACSSAAPARGTDAASDDASATVFDAVADLSGQERTDYLVERAEKEGGVLNLYTSYSGTTLPAIVAAFEKAYPIDIIEYRATPEEVAQKVTQEFKANYADPADVVEARGVEMEQMSKDGMIRSVDGDYLDDLPDDARFENWTADRLNQITPCWNTSLVTPGEEPKSWKELADPKWKGRLAMENLDNNWFQTMTRYFLDQGESQAEVDEYWAALAANSASVQGHSHMQEMIVAGQYDVGVSCYTYIVEDQKATGAPSEWQPTVEPVVSQPNGVGIGVNATHPAAAILFYDWILTDGQQVLADTGNTVPTAAIDYETIPMDLDGFLEDISGWTDAYDALLRGKGE